MSETNVDPMKRSSIYATFGRYYGEKLYRLLYDCCSGRPGSFCYEVLNCLGISLQGSSNLVLNQQGQWVENGSPSCEVIQECIGISPSGNVNLYLNQQGDWTEAGSPNCEYVKDCIGINEEGDESLFLNEQGNWIHPPVAPSQFQYEIGQYVESEGGVIAHRWLSTTPFGSPNNGTIQNYLILDINDLSSYTPWDDGTNLDVPGANSDWDGKTNTDDLISAGAPYGIVSGTAAYICYQSNAGGKTDWYLPSVTELFKIWSNKWEISQGILNAMGQLFPLASFYYWSSTESDYGGFANQAFSLNFGTGTTEALNKTANSSVRAVRKFYIS